MTNFRSSLRLAFALLVAAFWCAAPAHAASCEDLAKLALPATAITSTEIVAKGAFVPPPEPPREAADPNAEPPEPVSYAAVPEPTLLAFAGVTTGGLLRRRRQA